MSEQFYELYHGDCLEILTMLEAESVDAIITDPPYERKYQYLYEAVARESTRLLVDGGSFLAILPHYAIAEILPQIEPHLKYRWMHCMWQSDGQHPRMAMGVEVMWKPIGWWVKRAWPQGRGFVRDGYTNSQPNKDNHPWAQSIDWAEFCLKMVPKGRIVLDPLMGEGTMGIACIQAGYSFIGIEIDEGYFNIAKERIEKAWLETEDDE